VEPIRHLGALLHAYETEESARASDIREVSECLAFGDSQRGVLLDKAGTDQEDIPDADVAAFSFVAQVEALVLCDGLQLGEGYVGGGEDGGLNTLRLGPAGEVEKDSTAGDAVRGPLLDAAFVVIG